MINSLKNIFLGTGTIISLLWSASMFFSFFQAVVPVSGGITAPISNEILTTSTIAESSNSGELADIDLASLNAFVDSVKDDSISTVVGMYVNEDFKYAVKMLTDETTKTTGVPFSLSDVYQFEAADHRGVTGILSHENAIGKRFYELSVGQKIVVVYGNAKIKVYQISDIHTYQALQPLSPTSDFVDPDNGKHYSSSAFFQKIFTGKHRLVLQTCYDTEEVIAWGRHIITADPIVDNSLVNEQTQQITPTAIPTEIPYLEIVAKDPLPNQQPTGQCRDGWFSYATPEQYSSICSRHQGLYQWLIEKE